MTRRANFLVALLGALSLCPFAGAQVRNSSVALARPSVHTAPSASPAAGLPANRPATLQISTRRRIGPGGGPFTIPFALDDLSGVPGLGFDFPHLAAVSSGRSQNSFSRFGRHHQGEGFFVPILFGGYPYYYDETAVGQPDEQPVQPAQSQPQDDVVQQAAAAQQGDAAASDGRDLSTPAADSQAATPVRDVGDFILVRRDGRILFASVFSVVGTQLQYVTPEGIRRTLAMSEVDAKATEQMNAARGTTVQLQQ